MFSPEYYSKLDPRFRDALRKLESGLAEPKSYQDAFKNFAGKFMIPQKLRNSYDYEFSNGAFQSLYGFAVYSFCYNNSDKKVYGFGDHRDLMFPHKNLEQRMNEYERQSYSFVPTKIRGRHEEMKTLYMKIKAAEGNLDEWFAALMEAKDHDFVCDNVEHFLANDLTEKKLWRKYIDYLKKYDFKLLLESYSKYCRFFTDDAEMLEEYRQDAIKYNAPISVPWKNPFAFEVYDDKFFGNRCKISSRVQTIPYENDPLTIHFDGRNATKPQFPFLSPTIRYILDNVNGEVLQKLFQTCKWFRASLPNVYVCYKFEETDVFYGYDVDAGEPLKFIEQSIKSFNSSFLNTNIDELFISTIFDFRSENRNALSDLIPKIYRCSAKYVEIWNQSLSLEELKFFIGNAVDLSLYNVRNSDGKKFNLETVLQLTPKIKQLTISKVEFTSESFQKVIDLQYKFDSIDLCNVNLDLLDPVKLAKFVVKSCSFDTKFYLYFQSMNNIDAFFDIFYKAMREKWTGDEEKMPSVCFREWI